MIPLIKTKLPNRQALMPELEKVLYSGYIAQGEVVDQFEDEFGNFINNKLCVSVNSGTSALHIALILSDVKAGDEVISTALTAEPTNTVITQTGAKIVWADIDPMTGNISSEDVERKITKKTKAIVVVDYGGVPVDVVRFQNIEKKYNIPIIQDSAHALGAKYNGEFLGNHFSFTTFSFQAIKHMTTVDGGMIVFNDVENFEKAKLIRWFGISKGISRLENDISIQGYKYHMNIVNATIGKVQLKGIESVLAKYKDNANYYNSELSNVNGLSILNYDPLSEPTYWLYTVLVENKHDFIKYMNENGVFASDLHKRNDNHSLFKDSKTELPNLDQFEKKWVHIPCGWWVNSDDREKIVDLIKKGW